MKNKNHKRKKEPISFSDDSIGSYIKSIYNLPLLDPNEEFKLIEKIRKGDEAAKEELIKGNLRIVLFLVKKYPVAPWLKSESVGAGNEGLAIAAEKIKYYKGKSKFCSYAGGYIHNKIRQIITKHRRYLEMFPCSLNQPLNSSDKKSALSERPPKIDFKTPEGIRQRVALGRILDTLTKQEAEVVRVYFGLDGQGGLSLREMRNQFGGLTAARLGQIKQQAIERLRHPSKLRMLKLLLSI